MSVVVLDCHGEWTDSEDPTVQSKSGYRLYFQRLFVDARTYVEYIRALSVFMKSSSVVARYPGMPAKEDWGTVCDTASDTWERGRLMGTIKRRKNLHRQYSFAYAITTTGSSRDNFDVDAALSEHFRKHRLAVLFATMLRVWDCTPSLPRAVTDNAFAVSRLYHLKK